MAFSIGVVGVGQFGGHFAHLFKLHPGVSDVFVVDERAEAPKRQRAVGLDGTFDSFEALLASDVDAVAIFTQRWTHGPLVVQALRAGKHVYSAVPMAISEEEIADIIDAVRETGLTYMMGETSYYNPATVFARKKHAEGAFGRIFYAEGDYVHDMDLGFYDAYQYSGGENWKATASYPPMLYPTHSIGGVLGAMPGHAVSVSCIGVRDERGDGVFDKEVSMFDNDFSNASALFELNDGGGPCASTRCAGWATRPTSASRGSATSAPRPASSSSPRSASGRTSTASLTSPTSSRPSPACPQMTRRWPTSPPNCGTPSSPATPRCTTPDACRQSSAAPNGHEGSHHFLVDDFVTAINTGTLPPVNAWVAARYTLPGIVAHQSALRGGERLPIRDFGDAPARV